MSATFARKYEFDEFQLDMSESVLRRSGDIVPLTPKAIQALDLLVQSSGRVVSRSHLIDSLWPDAFVEESNLTVTISMLRKALGERGGEASLIETVAKRGYRFVRNVRAASARPRKELFKRMQMLRFTHD